MKRRIKKRKIIGMAGRPRLSVYRALKNIHAQIIDDSEGRTLVSASTLKTKSYGGNLEAAREAGARLARAAAEVGIKKVVFDRGKFSFHGRIKALADAARQGGLEF